MKRKWSATLASTLLALLVALPGASLAAEPAPEAKKSTFDWLTIGGDYRFRADSLNGKMPTFFNFFDPSYQAFLGGGPAPSPTAGADVKNETLYTNRFGLNLKAKASQNVSASARLVMFKTFGSQDDSAVSGLRSASGTIQPFFADRVGVFDGTTGHIPADGKVFVDYAYVTINNIFDQPIWFSVGRRPSTGGIPSHLRQNNEKPGNAGIPALLVDYAFDGATLGYAPDIEALPGAYAKLCYGRAFENGFTLDSGNGLRDTDMIGVSLVPYDTDRLYMNLQWNRGMNIFNSPVIKSNTVFGNTQPSVDLGDIDWFGLTLLSTMKKVGPGTLNIFGSGALDKTHPNGKTVILSNGFDTGAGLMFTGRSESTTGWAAHIGGRYDITATRTKIGAEYNHGSKNWISFVPAGDDIWTSKLGARGNVYEIYLIQELNEKAVSSHIAKTFLRVGYQYYDFTHTGSNNWVGAPVKMSELVNAANAQMLVPVEKATDFYATVEVKF
ncbi:MAG: DUF3373 domain-containing protein [Deltaproteobacteria bacterium]|nr:DUF3373 domain-containing protein [Deltaproteobacteria bacterium]